MAVEKERKFLVIRHDYRLQAKPVLYHQGFLSTVKERVVRIRIADARATLTIKGLTEGISRHEFEYPIPLEDAQLILESLCEKPTLRKYRYRIDHQGFTWEVDEFLDENEGLIIAELELEDEDQDFPVPDWIGREITSDPRYYNSNLVQNPYSLWRSGI
ncbi:MAG: CYTH domain-containing protein [Bacteroidales bacterium]|nr:CYTH domain-containing protein [Bacteroidales bacterium]